MRLHTIEGNTFRLDGGAMFGNAPRTMWEKWATPNENNQILLASRCLLIQPDDGRNILLETGIGAFFAPKLKERYGIESTEHVLLKNLKALGVEEIDIDAVVLSHLHFDHAGGLLPEYGDESLQLHFPNATYYVSKRHWEYAQQPQPREAASFIPLLQELLDKSDRLVLVDAPTHRALDFGLTFRFSDGHTVGLMTFQIDLPTGPLIFASDLIPGMPWVHLPLTMGYDRFAELEVNEKRELYESLQGKNAKLFFFHDPKVACGELKQNDKGRYFAEPVELDALI